MRLARVVGNVVSTIKNKDYYNYKLMIVEFMDEKGRPTEPRQIAFDGAGAGAGDLVLVNIDGGAANIILEDKAIVADYTICGIVDYFTYEGKTTQFREFL
jgi:microcompartment protein CcmK/EutM